MTSRASALVPALALALVASGACSRTGTTTEVGESAAGTLGYEPPEAGSYDLPPIQAAADGGILLAGSGEPARLHDLMGDRLVLLAFVYTRCASPEGCPLATATFQRLRARIERDPDLSPEVRLVTLSFDPARDSPGVMSAYAEAAGVDDHDSGWAFATTSGPESIEPILEGYGQFVVPEIDESGAPTGQLAHVLKVFLIDRQLRVRNIYSSDFLHPELVVTDLRTLMLEEGSEPAKG